MSVVVRRAVTVLEDIHIKRHKAHGLGEVSSKRSAIPGKFAAVKGTEM